MPIQCSKTQLSGEFFNYWRIFKNGKIKKKIENFQKGRMTSKNINVGTYNEKICQFFLKKYANLCENSIII